MKQITAFLLLVIGMMTGVGLPGLQACSLSNTNIGTVEEPILIRIKRPGDPTGAPRVPSAVQISAEYDDVSGAVIAYLANAGASVDVSIENLSTGESYDDAISGSGMSILPISGSSGTWVITFTLPSGDVYEGEFVL